MKAFTLVLVLAVCGCHAVEQLSDVSCPDEGTELTYENFGAPFMAEWCTRCHSSDASNRHGAPGGFDFETLAGVRRHPRRIFARAAGDNDSMPPGPNDPPAAAREKLAEWLACGAPALDDATNAEPP